MDVSEELVALNHCCSHRDLLQRGEDDGKEDNARTDDDSEHEAPICVARRDGAVSKRRMSQRETIKKRWA